uniref:Uncharacterized protein n=1 Tax=Oryza nivara TaxID=4536 RepID=A0A0E0GU07_ORYNI
MLPRGGGRRSPGELGALPGWTPAGEPEASRRRRRRRRASRLAQTPCRARAGGHIGRAAGGAAARSRERQGYLVSSRIPSSISLGRFILSAKIAAENGASCDGAILP